MNGISIGFDYEKGEAVIKSQFDKDLNLTDDDKAIADHFIQIIGKSAPAAHVTLERRADEYLSLCVGDNDFLRFKYTPRARWISVAVWGLDISPDDPRFSAQKNKQARFWKASIRDVSDLSDFDDVVVASCCQNMN